MKNISSLENQKKNRKQKKQFWSRYTPDPTGGRNTFFSYGLVGWDQLYFYIIKVYPHSYGLVTGLTLRTYIRLAFIIVLVGSPSATQSPISV